MVRFLIATFGLAALLWLGVTVVTFLGVYLVIAAILVALGALAGKALGRKQ